MKSVHDERYKQLLAALVEARKGAGLTQAEVALKLERPQSFVSKYESGERRLDVVEFLDVCAVMNASPLGIIRRI